MNMTIPVIILAIVIVVGLSQVPIVVKDFWQDVKEIYNIK